ncbi:lipopolysaccharide assembly protein LapB [Streptomyces sp. NBC_00620]|uniref:tetratricopeptide repeat protein n=1 Tax=Streptomyces sp. NBC_00620 TaxID=2903666 RepID=UPI00224D1CF9|nr:tetratricopeptide repeat protein [Streptomyces sp. NBC_00620]MCX4974059.1 tetratricopeptide repeat protein [Streptomyces sp. NBC_00620]
MEIEEQRPAAQPQEPEPSGSRFSPFAKWALISAAAGCVVLGGVLVLLPSAERDAAPPAPGPVARAQTAVGAGVPASLPDLAALIGDREAHLRAHPRDVQSWAVLGTAYVEQGRRTATPAYYPKAEQALRTSLKARPKGNVEALDGLAALANARGDFRAGKKWGEAAVKLAPKRWTTYPLLLDAYTGLGDYKATRKALDKLLELRSGPTVTARAARVYWDRGWREDAAAAVADAAARAATPTEQAAFLQQAGELAWERGDREQSLGYYERALRTDPDEHSALAGQGRALVALGRTSEALRAYQTALAKRPEPRYALELGELYEKLGVDGAARVQYDLLRERAREEAAGGVDDALVLGLFEADHGDPAAAVQLLRTEWKRHGGIAVADALGWALHRVGEHEEALKFATRAMDKEHGGAVRSALYAYHRGQIERSLEQYGPARRHLAEALRINPYFSPLLVPQAEAGLEALGEPSAEEGPGESAEEESGEAGESADEPSEEPSAEPSA